MSLPEAKISGAESPLAVHELRQDLLSSWSQPYTGLTLADVRGNGWLHNQQTYGNGAWYPLVN